MVTVDCKYGKLSNGSGMGDCMFVYLLLDALKGFRGFGETLILDGGLPCSKVFSRFW